MGGRGSSSRNAGSSANKTAENTKGGGKSESVEVKQTAATTVVKKASGKLTAASVSAAASSPSAAEKFVSTSVKSVTKGMTQESVKKLSRSQLETISILQTAKSYMKIFKVSAEEAVRRARLMVPQQTTAQLRKDVWKRRNMD